MKSLRLFFLLSFIFILSFSTAVANDSEYYTSGNQLIPLRQTSVRVTKEILSIDLREGRKAFVDVYYEFTNPTAEPKTVLMGFEADPPYPEGLMLKNNMKHPYIKNFTVEINGQKQPFKNAISRTDKFKPINVKGWGIDMGGLYRPGRYERETEYIYDFAFVYYFNATFNPGVTKIHHTYSYDLGTSTMRFFFLNYKLSPAARWANKQIDDFTLVISANNTAKHFYVPCDILPGVKPKVVRGAGKVRQATQGLYDDEAQLMWEIALRKGAVRFHTTRFKPKKELDIYSPYFCSPYQTLGYTYDRTVGTFIQDCADTDLSEQDRNRIMRNLPYANRGYVFHDPMLKQFFESLWWYMPDPAYKPNTSDFTPREFDFLHYSGPDNGQ